MGQARPSTAAPARRSFSASETGPKEKSRRGVRSRPRPGPAIRGAHGSPLCSGTDKGRVWGTAPAEPQSCCPSKAGDSGLPEPTLSSPPQRAHSPAHHRGAPVLTMHSRTRSWKSCSRRTSASCSVEAMLRQHGRAGGGGTERNGTGRAAAAGVTGATVTTLGSAAPDPGPDVRYLATMYPRLHGPKEPR